MTVDSLLYVSSAVREPSEAEIDHLLTRARARNERENITGVLLYCDGCFMQYIEGPRDSLRRVFAAILDDRLHTDVLELLHEHGHERAFPDWSMSLHRPDLASSQQDHCEAAFQKLMAVSSTRVSPVHHLLLSFWNNGLAGRFGGASYAELPLGQAALNAMKVWRVADMAASDSEGMLRLQVTKLAQRVGQGAGPDLDQVRKSDILRRVSNASLLRALTAVARDPAHRHAEDVR